MNVTEKQKLDKATDFLSELLQSTLSPDEHKTICEAQELLLSLD